MRSWNDWYEERARTGALTPETVGYRSTRVWVGVQSALRVLLPRTPGLRILDVGCGHGMMLAPWTESSLVVGLDVTRSMLTLARGVGLSPVQGDARVPPFRPESFDVVVSVEMLQHLDDVDRLVAELARLVRPGGSLVLGTANSASVVRRLANGAMRIGLLSREGPARTAPPRARSLAAILDSGRRAGLVAHRIAVNYFPLTLARRVARVGRIQTLLVSNFMVAFRRPDGPCEADW